MYRIDNPSSATSLPTIKPPGPGGYFTAGNVNVGQSATIVEADFLNGIQEEIVNVVLKGGLVLNKSNNGQLLQALSNLFTGSFTMIGITQDIPVPDWATRIEFELTGAGGGGAHCNASAATGTNYWSGGGGAAGGYAQAIRYVTPGTVLHAVIGVGGVSDAPGTDSSLTNPGTGGWVVTCTGGGCGFYMDPDNSRGGDGGVATGGDLNCGGSSGGDAETGGVFETSGHGGPGPYGGAGLAAGVSEGPTRAGGKAPGSGGGGAYDENKTNGYVYGGSGANGLLKYRFLP